METREYKKTVKCKSDLSIEGFVSISRFVQFVNVDKLKFALILYEMNYKYKFCCMYLYDICFVLA